jgi:hypothetical protein
MLIPQIHFSQQPARLGIDADLGTQDIKQPRPVYEMTTERPQVQLHSPNGELFIDSSRAWDDIGVGGHLESMQRIYTNSKQVAIDGVTRRVLEGNRLAAIHTHENAIKEIAKNPPQNNGLDTLGEASYLNVSEQYIAHPVEVNYTEGKVNIKTQPSPPQIEYNRGKLDIYMAKWPSIEFTPPAIDLKM